MIFGSVILEVALGVILLYLLLSVVCSSVNELVAWALNWRAKTLKNGIQQLLNDPTLQGIAEHIYQHPLIKPLHPPGKAPSYIPSQFFALALCDVLKEAVASNAPSRNLSVITQGGTPGGSPAYEPLTLAGLQKTIASLPADSSLRKVLSMLVDESVTGITHATQRIAHWFDGTMERVSGWYRRKSQIFLFVCAFVLSLGLNLDTLMMANLLLHDSVLRSTLAITAQEVAKQPRPEASGSGASPQESLALIAGIEDKLEKIQFPMGWTVEGPRRIPANFREGLIKLAGILLTTFALSLGAPFWFDSLNKLINLRAAGMPPAKSHSGDA